MSNDGIASGDGKSCRAQRQVDVTDRTALYASGRRKARFHRRLRCSPCNIVPSRARSEAHRACPLADRNSGGRPRGAGRACDGFRYRSRPGDDAAPGDVLTVERLEIDRSAIFHVNDLGFFPGRGEEQSEDESKTGHGVLHRQGRKDLRLQRGGSKRLRRSGYTNLIPITSPFFQATLQALPGDVRSNFS